MMGTKERYFAPLINVSVEQLVPHDHFYRHLERTLDLSFVREFVQKTYAHGGRPSIDRARVFQAPTGHVFRGHSAMRKSHIVSGEEKQLLQARVQACHQFLRAFPVTGGCEARSNV
jgi:hypothetical protein